MNKADIAETLKRRYPKSISGKGSVFILEEYVHTGETIGRLQQAAQEMGFRKVRVGVLTAPLKPGALSEKLDFVGTTTPFTPLFYGARKRHVNALLSYRDRKKQPMPSKDGQFFEHFLQHNAKQAKDHLKQMRARIRAAAR